MSVFDLLRSAWRSLIRTKSRSLLTMLGMIIGVSSVILVLSIGESAQRYIVDQVSVFGSDLLQIANGPKESGANSTPSLFVKESLTMKDYQKLTAEPWVRRIVAGVSQDDLASVNGEDVSVQVAGTTPDEVEMYSLDLAQGYFFTQEDVDARGHVAVLGSEVAETGFGRDNPLGKSIKIGQGRYRIIGVMAPQGTQSFQNLDKKVYLPVTTVMDLYNRTYLMGISLKTDLPVNDASRRIEDVLRSAHKIERTTDDDFHVQTQEDAIRSTTQITSILQILLASIAAISLVVGGIGIMNIMYVSVTERIREIGLRKAIGARPSDILRQFLMEAVLLTTIGGLIGLTVGISFAWLAIFVISSFQSGWTFLVSTQGIGMGLGVSMAIGVLFGWAPARRAASLSPIEALRHE